MICLRGSSWKGIILLGLALLLLGSETTFGQQYQVGDTVSDFTLNDPDSNAISLSDFPGKAVVLGFLYVTY
jgi:cytochrome oxidase Cu insertion factor (SCO1/SenC/PrrC family)